MYVGNKKMGGKGETIVRKIRTVLFFLFLEKKRGRGGERRRRTEKKKKENAIGFMKKMIKLCWVSRNIE